MKENKQIEKELLFKNNIKDITSISLDSDYKIEQRKIVGNFLITGDYKIHEVSINREKFNFKIPFKHELEENIDEQTVKLEITNFEYDYNKDELIVNIEYDIIGDREDVFIFDDKESLEDFLNTREVEVVDTRIADIKQEINKKEEIEISKPKEEEIVENEKVEKKEEIKEEKKEEKKEGIKETKEIPKPYIVDPVNTDRIEVIEKIEESITENKINNSAKNTEDKLEVSSEMRDKIETDKIINNVEKIEDAYITYKVYTIKENETLESIVIKYHTTIDELNEYNDLSNLSVNDKIIIPYYE